jgi:hypothetical protein
MNVMADSERGEHLTRGESVVELIDAQVARGERTLTPMGKELLEARRCIERSGIPLLGDEQLDEEKATRSSSWR